MSVLDSPRSSEEQWAAKSPCALLWTFPTQDRVNIPEVAPPRGGGMGPGLAPPPRPCSPRGVASTGGGAAAAGGAGAEGARSPPPPGDPAAKLAARAAQTGPATLGLRRDAPAHQPLDPRARRHKVTASASRGSAHHPGRAGPTFRRPGRADFLGLFCHVAGRRWGPRIGGQSTKPGGGQRESLGPSARIPARAAEGKRPQGPSATPEREREAGGGGRTGTGHPAPSPAAFQTGEADEVIPSGSLLATAATARAGPDRDSPKSPLQGPQKGKFSS